MKQKLSGRLESPGKIILALFLFAAVQVAQAQDFVWAPDLPVGASLPEVSAQDQNGDLRSFNELVGENGMLFMLSRSFDW